jgi:HEAT repeat protein
MLRTVTCPRCEAPFEIEESLRGRQLTCPDCKLTFVFRPWETPSVSPAKALSGVRPLPRPRQSPWLKVAVAAVALVALLLIAVPISALLIVSRMATPDQSQPIVSQGGLADDLLNGDPGPEPPPQFAAVPGKLVAGKPRVEAPAPAAQVEPDAISVAVEKLRDANVFTQAVGAGELERMTPVPARQAQVVSALKAVIEGPEPFAPRAACTRALGVWGGREEARYILTLVEDRDNGVRASAMLTLGKLKDARAAEPIARRLANPADRRWAGRALKDLGSAAESAVRARLRHPDAAVRIEACHVLKAIGTSASHAALKETLTDPNTAVAQAARDALPPGQRTPEYGPQEIMTINVHVRHPEDWPALEAQLRALADTSPAMLKVTTSGDYKWVKLAPVHGDAETFARKIPFGKIVAVHNNQRLIYVDPEKR